MAQPQTTLRDQVIRLQTAGVPEDEIKAFIIRFNQEQTASEKSNAPKKSSWTSALPMVGATAGSLLGGSKASPVGMALAGIGGAAGEAWRQTADAVRGDFSNIPDSMLGRLKQIGVEGAKQAGLEGGGRLFGAMVQPVAKAMYALAARPSRAAMRDVGGPRLVEGLKRIVGQGYADNVIPSALGAGRAEALVRQSVADANAAAARNQTPIALDRVMQHAVDDQLRRGAARAASAGVEMPEQAMRNQVQRVVRAYAPTPAPPLGPSNITGKIGGTLSASAAPAVESPMVSASQLLQIRRGADEVATPAFKAAKQPGGTPVALGSEASVSKSIGDAARHTLNDVLGQSFRDINQRTIAREAMKRTADESGARLNVLMTALSGAGGLASLAAPNAETTDAIKNALLLRLLASPTVLGTGALAVGKAPYAHLLRTGHFALAPKDQE